MDMESVPTKAKARPPITDARADAGDAFPVTVQAIVAFVMSPVQAFERIVNDAHRRMHDSGESRHQFNEGVNYTFTYGGIKHDVTLTREDT